LFHGVDQMQRKFRFAAVEVSVLGDELVDGQEFDARRFGIWQEGAGSVVKIVRRVSLLEDEVLDPVQEDPDRAGDKAPPACAR
jgi:hypothetical protein